MVQIFTVQVTAGIYFHIQEKQYNLEDIKNLIDKFNMKFVGFDFINQYTQQYLNSF